MASGSVFLLYTCAHCLPEAVSICLLNTLKIMHIFHISSKTNVQSHWFFFLWNLSCLLRAIVHFLTNVCILQSKIPHDMQETSSRCWNLWQVSWHQQHLECLHLSLPGFAMGFTLALWPLLKSNFCQSISGRLDSPGLLRQCQVLDTRSGQLILKDGVSAHQFTQIPSSINRTKQSQ